MFCSGRIQRAKAARGASGKIQNMFQSQQISDAVGDHQGSVEHQTVGGSNMNFALRQIEQMGKTRR